MRCFFEKIAEGDDANFQHWWNFVPKTEHVLLLSGMGGRYSFWGFDPLLQVEVRSQNQKKYFIELRGGDKKKTFSNKTADEVLDFLYELISKHEAKIRSDFPLPVDVPFRGGLMGFFSYDFGVRFENFQQRVRDDVGYPAAFFILPKQILIFDHEKEVLQRVGLAENHDEWKAWNQRFNNLVGKNKMRRLDLARRDFTKIVSNLTFEEYLKKVSRVQDYLKRGHSYQVNFSQRFQVKTEVDPFQIFQKVTAINPSPYQAFIRGGDFAVISNSPERLVRVFWNRDERIVETRPIKGTMPRSNDPAQDEQNRRELLASKKDAAELAMIVDLERNDIGKVCKMGSVEVTEHRTIEGYSHVWHTVSNVRGVLERDKDFRDVVRALFPGGSITGCPKKRTIEIIDALEDYARGVYTGSAGYISFDGALDLNIMIRTMFWKDGRVYFHSGGGIVIDSKPKNEYKETLYKAQALVDSITI